MPSAPPSPDDASPVPPTSLDRQQAPATRLDGTSAPPTTLDRPSGADPAPATHLDGGGPGAPMPRTALDGVPGEPPGSAPGTVLDGTSGPPGRPTTDVGSHRVNLPRRLDASHRLDRVLGSGGEADLLLATELATTRQVVVRRYRENRTQLDEELLSTLADADQRHLIGVLSWGRDADAVWEILEYAPHGSLSDLRAKRRRTWSPAEVRQVVEQLAAALAYAHSLRLVHRDVKPSNILVRSVDPLDLVLTDFGLTRVLTATEVMATTSRTSAYAAPEAASGAISHALDWWALGMLAVELLTGLHPFQRADGGWLNDMQILKQLTTRDVALDEVTDPHWRLLCEGLLTRDPRERWNQEQVTAWLAGQRPPVAARGAAATRSERPLAFARQSLFTPVEAAAAFRANWPEASRLIRGRELNSPAYLGLNDWVQDLGLERPRLVLARDSPPDRRLTQLILALDPTTEPVFRGRQVSLPGLVHLMQAAGTDPGAAQVIDGIYTEGILDVVDGAPGCAGLGQVAERWRFLVETVERQLPAPARGAMDADRMRIVRLRMLAVALSPDGGGLLVADAGLARNDPEAMAQDWFRRLAGTRGGPAQPAYDELVIVLRDVAVQQTQQARATAAALEVQQEQARRYQQRHRVDRASATLAFACGLAALLVPFAAIIAGPAAVYFGVRARRNGPPGCLATGGMWVGLLSCIGYLIYLIALVAAAGS
jgi:tRNA A-37 threonylcarbamoyl transferase component Bud32